MLKLIVGLSKKAGLPDFGSVGASCSVEVELISTQLQHDPDTFQQQARQAFDACAQSVNEELARQQGQGAGTPTNNAPTANGSSQRRDRARKATASQIRALHAIADRNHIQLAEAAACSLWHQVSPKTCRSPRPLR